MNSRASARAEYAYRNRLSSLQMQITHDTDDQVSKHIIYQLFYETNKMYNWTSFNLIINQKIKGLINPPSAQYYCIVIVRISFDVAQNSIAECVPEEGA